MSENYYELHSINHKKIHPSLFSQDIFQDFLDFGKFLVLIKKKRKINIFEIKLENGFIIRKMKHVENSLNEENEGSVTLFDNC